MNSLLDRAWKVGGLSTLERLVLVRLADRANESGECWPSQANLAGECSATTRGIRDALAVLVKAGHVSVAALPSFNTSARYKVHPKAPEPDSPPELTSPPEVTSGPNLTSQPSGTHFRGVRKSLPPNPHRTVIEPPPCPKGDEVKSQAELLHVEPAPKAKAKGARKRNPIFDALAVACGHNLGELTDSGTGSIVKAVSQIRKASPDVTPEEIGRRVENYRRKHPSWGLTPPAIAKHWAELGGGGTRSREELEAILAKHPGNPDWTGYLAETVTMEQRQEFADLLKELKRLSQPQSRAA